MDLFNFPEIANLPDVSMAIAPLVAAAGITAISSLFGAKKGSDAAKDSSQIQTDYAQKALDEQKRVYDLEKADEQRQRTARAGIFEQYGTNPGTFAGNLPNAFGLSDGQMATMREGNMGNPGNAGKALPPALPPTGGTTTQPVPTGPGTQPAQPWGQRKPTVTLQAPTGEIMDVPIDQAQALIRKGAIMIPTQGAQNAFGGSYGMV